MKIDEQGSLPPRPRRLSLLRTLPAAALAIVVSLAAPASPALAACGQPVSGGESPTLLDCLHIAKASVAGQPCSPCICDVNGSGQVRVTDALRCLWYVVGADVALECPECVGTTTTTLPDCAPCGHVLLGLADPGELCEEDIELYDATRTCPCSQCHEECMLLCPSHPPAASATSDLAFDQKGCSACYAENCAPLLRECVER